MGALMSSLDHSEQLLPDFDGLANLFVQAGAFCSPAEFHGSLCGHLAAGGRYEPTTWLAAATELMEITEVRDESLVSALQSIYQVSLEQLSNGRFEFSLLVPEDEAPMSVRAEALGQWCHGFLSSYGIAGGGVEGQLSEDALDAIQDMVQISQIAAESGEDEGEEADFVEVFEYVRMSAMLIFSECNTDSVGANGEDQSELEQNPPAGKLLH
ncbi:hypothetical protein BGP75_04495 [Motiliproteus sp. MSK22-1]|nr:hypothetical protein BGP75_04495 [Motiliproteus sp. MSK22-1]